MTMTERFLLRLEDMLPNLIAAVIILVAGFLITRVTLRIMGKGLNLKHVDPTIHKFLMSMVKVVMTVIIVVSALSAVKVPMSSIIAAIGTAGIAIGLALQDSLSNVAGGFVILFAKPFKCGDYVKRGTDEGTVDAISILYTRLLTIDNKAVFIPNSNVAKSSVTNFTDEDRRRLEIRFAVSYRDDFRKAEKLIREVIEGHQKILTSPEKPLVVMDEHGSHGIIILTRSWVKTADYWQTKWDILAAVKDTFDANGITIPFDQMDVHITEK